MKIRNKAVILTLIFGIGSLILSTILWDTSPDMPVPTMAQMPFLAGLGIIESIVFGLGMSFLILGWPLIKALPKENHKSLIISYVCLGWLTISWWSHDNFHRDNGANMTGLLFIEYAYHVTLMIAALILTYQFLQMLRRKLVA